MLQNHTLVIVVALLALAGCKTPSSSLGSATAQPSAAPTKVHLTANDAGKTVDLAKGGTINVTLGGNPTTGYSWTLLAGADTVLKQQGPPGYVSENTGLTGSGGQFTFTFQAIGTGNGTLKFGYLRPWEKNTPPVQTFEVTIDVQ